MRSTLAVRQRIGKRIAQLRIQRALNQEELAELVGMNAKHLGLVERGGSNVGIDTLSAIADSLGVDLIEFFMPLKAGGRPVERIWTERDYREIDDALAVLGRVRRRGNRA